MKAALVNNFLLLPGAKGRGDQRRSSEVFDDDSIDNSTPRYSSRVASAMKNRLQRSGSQNLTEYSDSDSDDDISLTSAGNEQTIAPQRQYWEELEDSIKKINNTQYFALKPKPNFKSSDSFKDVMTDMYGNSEYGSTRGYTKLKEKINKLTNISGLASRMFARVITDDDSMDITDDKDDAVDEEEEKARMKSELIGAKRSWKLIKRHVQETTMEKNTEKTKFNWDMISHHVKGMTDLEKARHDLYKRYGVIPTIQENGKYECKNVMWSERAIRLNQTNPGQYNVYSHDTNKRRVQSASPVKSRKESNAQKTINGKVRPASETRVKILKSTNTTGSKLNGENTGKMHLTIGNNSQQSGRPQTVPNGLSRSSQKDSKSEVLKPSKVLFRRPVSEKVTLKRLKQS